MIVSITGVPASGKSTAASELERRGYRVIRIEDLIEGAECGTEDDSTLVDIDIVDRNLRAARKRRPSATNGEIYMVVGHLSHLLSSDMVVVLRARPEIIRKRLVERGYSRKKILENVEAEAIDLITIESVQEHEKVYEIDCSDKNMKEICDTIEEILRGNGEEFRAGAIDFSEEIMGWF